MRKYRNKLQRSGIEDCALVGHHPGSIQHHHPGVVVDSDSEFEMKDKSSSRAKFSRVSQLNHIESYRVIPPSCSAWHPKKKKHKNCLLPKSIFITARYNCVATRQQAAEVFYLGGSKIHYAK